MNHADEVNYMNTFLCRGIVPVTEFHLSFRCIGPPACIARGFGDAISLAALKDQGAGPV